MIYTIVSGSMIGTFLIGKYIQIKYINWYLLFVLSMNIYNLHNIPFIYTDDYLFSDIQPYPHLIQLTNCVNLFLMIDFRNHLTNYEMIFHHISCIVGMTISLSGFNVGISNNCIKNEYTTAWLALATLSLKYEKYQRYNSILITIFIYTFFFYRVVPCSMIMYRIMVNYTLITRNIITIIQFLAFTIHCIIQYLWFFRIFVIIYNTYIPYKNDKFRLVY